MKTIAYLRVSTSSQDLDKNKTDILKLANEKRLGNVDFVEEKISGKISWKTRKIAGIIDELKEGDNLIVSELSRLGRSMMEIMEILDIAVEKKIKIFSVKGSWQLDNTIQSKLIAMCFSMSAEIERELISSRIKEGLAAKKASGVKLGRKKGIGKSRLDEWEPEIVALINNHSPKRFIAKRYKVSETALFNWLRKHNIKIQEQ